ncbi:efflux transporter periplasmic adaptor subunit, partial [Escherichia coli]|nr:efflux transporter periplasmic adaptor subunit [Escherichia coli]
QTGAQLQTARINLHFTRVPAPITGRIGRSLVTEGALVTTNQADPLAVIQRLDPIFVDIQQSSTELLALRRALAQQGVTPG